MHYSHNIFSKAYICTNTHTFYNKHWAIHMSNILTSTGSRALAEKLLQVGAVKLNAANPFTWASGWKSPIYCDNRKSLSFPYVRDFIKSELCSVIFEQFPEADSLAGVATAGIPWGGNGSRPVKASIYVCEAKAKRTWPG